MYWANSKIILWAIIYKEAVKELWEQATTETLANLGDLQGYRTDFYQLFGFEVQNVDYAADTQEVVKIQSIAE